MRLFTGLHPRARRTRTSRLLTLGVSAASLTLALVGASTATTAAAASPMTKQSELVALHDAQWTPNVKVTYAKSSWTFSSPGIPPSSFVASDYAVPSNPFDVSATGASIISATTALKDQNYDYALPLTPTYSATVTKAPMGPIGVMIDGAVLYNPYEANDSTVATKDNFIARVHGVSASFLDSCDGHPGGPGEYHYHGLPTCLVDYATGQNVHVASVASLQGATTSAVSEVNAASRRPVLVGVAFDGYGVYDNVSMSGRVVPVAALDACNGIDSPVPGYPHGIYHYVLENVKGAHSSVACFHGVVSSAYTSALQHTLDITSSAPSAAANGRSAQPADLTVDAYLVALLRADTRAQC